MQNERPKHALAIGDLVFDGEVSVRRGCAGPCCQVKTPPRSGHVNTGPEHMPLGLADHRDHIRRLASRGQRDES